LTAFAKDLGKREAELAKVGEGLRAERDLEIRTAHKDGLPEEAIARVLEISQQRVSQILRS
jgi:DNA-directed RNA polymerase specialized sigma subunit